MYYAWNIQKLRRDNLFDKKNISNQITPRAAVQQQHQPLHFSTKQAAAVEKASVIAFQFGLCNSRFPSFARTMSAGGVADFRCSFPAFVRSFLRPIPLLPTYLQQNSLHVCLTAPRLLLCGWSDEVEYQARQALVD